MDMKDCEICGDVGWVPAIRVCSKCKVTREHVYCMRVTYEGDPDKWVCEECVTLNKKTLLKPAQQQIDLSASTSKIRKPPQHTKVKYLQLGEVVRMESGAAKDNSLSTKKASSSTRPPINNMSLPRRAPSGFITRPNPQFAPSGFSKPLNVRNVPSCSTVRNLSTSKGKSSPRYVQWETASTKPPLPSGKCHKINIEKDNADPGHSYPQIVPGVAAVDSGKLHKINIEKDNKDPGHSSPQVVQGLAAVNSGLGVCTDPQPRKVGFELKESAEVAMKLDKYLPNHPAASPRWRGDFKLRHDIISGELVDGLQAHPPCKVHRKVYEFALQLPESLEFRLLPRPNIWSDLFEDDAPGGLDIGLYFLPSERNEQAYACLVEFLDQCDMLLSTHINSVELLVSSSKHLESNSQRINGRCFLWGVFRASDDNMVASASTANAINSGAHISGIVAVTPAPPVVGPLAGVGAIEPVEDRITSNGPKSPPPEDCGDDGMEIDMVGGQDVGTPDVVINKPKEAVAEPPEETSDSKATGTFVMSPPGVQQEPKTSTTFSKDFGQELNRQLQEQFDKFSQMFHGTEAACVVKMEVKAEEETWE